MLKFLEEKNGEDLESITDVADCRKKLIERILNKDRQARPDNKTGLYRPGNNVENQFSLIQKETAKGQWSAEEAKKAMKKLTSLVEELGT